MDFFQNVVTVWFSEPDDQAEVFRQLGRLRRLEQLTPHVAVRNSDVGHIAGLRNLKRVDLMQDCPELTDEALRMLSQIPSLEAERVNNFETVAG
jgi:hypothetical protein